MFYFGLEQYSETKAISAKFLGKDIQLSVNVQNIFIDFT